MVPNILEKFYHEIFSQALLHLVSNISNALDTRLSYQFKFITLTFSS